MESTKSRSLLGWIGIYALWVVMTLVTLLPIYWMLVVSSRTASISAVRFGR